MNENECMNEWRTMQKLPAVLAKRQQKIYKSMTYFVYNKEGVTLFVNKEI